VRVRVVFFGQLRESVGLDQDTIDLEQGVRVAEVFSRYAQRCPLLHNFRAAVVPAVNLQPVGWDELLHDGDEVAFLPPISGGAVSLVEAAIRCALIEGALEPETWLRDLVSPHDGALVTFEGHVRDHSREGRPVLAVEYEAYAPMAEKCMRALAVDLRRRFGVDRVVLVHRLGRVPVGQASVLIAVTAGHRAAAFDACRFAIDAFKRTVPIWKKEIFPDGAAWVTGEPLAALDA
jgi:molybdopterin converting factor subunit 1